MTTIGILHGGSRKVGQKKVDEAIASITKSCKAPVTFKVADWDGNLLARAKSLMSASVVLVQGGSRNATAAMRARGSAKTPILVFTTVSQYVVNRIADPSITTGVCCFSSDDDGNRLGYLLDFLGYAKPTIGVLWNSSREDQAHQWQSISDAAEGNCELVPRDVNNSSVSIRSAFADFTGAADGVLVAGDPFFYSNRPEVVDRANTANIPTIYQWREFVEVGGLMSHGPNYNDCHTWAQAMVTSIGAGHAVPPVTNAPFELVISQSKATHFVRWPLPSSLPPVPPTIILP
jgi:putative tryptophan/tyrosine transport system substrate-binding protein